MLQGFILVGDKADIDQVLLDHFAGFAAGISRDARGVTLDFYSPTATIWMSTLFLGGSDVAPFIFRLW